MVRLLPLLVLLIGCPPVEADPVAPEEPWTDRLPELSDPDFVVPGEGLPLTPQRANNNLAVIDHAGRTYLAWRTAPSHFASELVQMHVVSSEDGEIWEHEVTFDLDTDLREPQFVSWEGTLRVYFAVLGTSSLDFEPQGMKASVRLGPGQWSEPEDAFEGDFIPWRSKVLDGRLYLIGYSGGGNIYDETEEPVRVHWLTSDDGVDWRAVVPGQEVVLEGGGSETDFVFLDDGSLLAVVRNEAGDEWGFGSKICTAPPEDLGNWTCAADPRKYDSPLLFREGPDVWLIGRRTLGNDGLYDLGQDDDPATLYWRYQIEYSNDPKRCTLWRVDPATKTVHEGLDLPSRGDTCFPDRRELGGGVHQIWNYTSPLDGDPTWIEGQQGDTLIYRIDLAF